MKMKMNMKEEEQSNKYFNNSNKISLDTKKFEFNKTLNS